MLQKRKWIILCLILLLVLLIIAGGIWYSNQTSSIPQLEANKNEKISKSKEQAVQEFDGILRSFLKDHSMLNAVILRSGTYQLAPGASEDVSFIADFTLQKLSISAWTPDENSKATLSITPSYQEDPINGPIGREPKAIEISSAVLGSWKLEIYNPGTEETSVNVLIIGFQKWNSSYDVRLYIDKERSNPEKMILSLTLEDAVKFTNYDVSATLRYPDQATVPLIFHDDGNGSDQKAVDGYYTCEIPVSALTQKGGHRVAVKISNTRKSVKKITLGTLITTSGIGTPQTISDNFMREFYIFFNKI